MIKYIIRRIYQMLIILVIVSIVVFSLVQMIPGDVATAILGDGASEEDYELLRERLGLDKPVYIRYLKWAGNMLQGDFGKSMINKFPVSQLFAQRLPYTIQLAISGMVFAVILGVPAGIIAALRQNSTADALIRGFSTFGTAMPNFWLGLILILIFSLWFRLLPSSGMVSISNGFFNWLKHIILPAMTLGIRFSAIVVRQTRSAFLDVMRADYVRTARAKGVAEFWVTYKHVLRNALIPVITVIGLQLGRLIGGAVVTEMIFQIPGMGSLIADAVFSRDIAVVQGGVMIATIGVLSINFIVDIVYGLIDPRVRASENGKTR
jgi:peptide/nickel transport system permease protein